MLFKKKNLIFYIRHLTGLTCVMLHLLSVWLEILWWMSLFHLHTVYKVMHVSGGTSSTFCRGKALILRGWHGCSNKLIFSWVWVDDLFWSRLLSIAWNANSALSDELGNMHLTTQRLDANIHCFPAFLYFKLIRLSTFVAAVFPLLLSQGHLCLLHFHIHLKLH